MILKSEHINGNNKKQLYNRFWWLGLIIGIMVLTAIIVSAIYDTVSGLDPNTIMRTAIVESFNRSGGDGAAVSTHFRVRFDERESASILVPEGTIFRNRHRVLIAERKSLAFGVKHYTFVKYLD